MPLKVRSEDLSPHKNQRTEVLTTNTEIAIPSACTCLPHRHMEQNTLPVEVILSHPRQSLGCIRLDWTPQPGNYLDLEGKTYAVLERHHRYQLKSGRYQLQKIALYVQSATPPTERTFISGIWVIGTASCRFNARSEILRCAVNPNGPCKGCRDYQKC
jgi:Family of unknown function (DUF6464)